MASLNKKFPLKVLCRLKRTFCPFSKFVTAAENVHLFNEAEDSNDDRRKAQEADRKATDDLLKILLTGQKEDGQKDA